MSMQLAAGLLLAAAVSFIAHRLQALTRPGAFAATMLGAIVFGLGGWQWAVLLLSFFILSSALSRLFRQAKRSAQEKYAKGSERDAMQVLSNGGLAGLFVVLHALFPGALWTWIGFAGALAAVNADTWATELGILDREQPRLITSLWKRVEKGTSGGVSPAGTAASLLAAAVIGGLAAWLSPSPQPSWTLLPVLAAAGLVGSLLDSALGATVQAIYFCPKDKKETERHPLHTCGTATVHIRGWRWLNNDWVNVACSLAGALAALLLALAARLI